MKMSPPGQLIGTPLLIGTAEYSHLILTFKKVSALTSKLTKKVSFEVRGVHSPQLGQYSGYHYQFSESDKFLITQTTSISQTL